MKKYSVVRVCEITGRLTVVANNLTEQEAKDKILAVYKDDPLATFFKVIEK